MNEDNMNTQGENNAPVQSNTPMQSAPVQGSNESPMQEYKNFYANGGKRNKAAVIALAIVCPLALAVAGIGIYLAMNNKTPDTPTPAPNPANPGNYEISGKFGIDFLRKAYSNEPKGNNIIVSPYSMEAVWRLAAAGANGDTKTEINNVFGGERTMPSFSQLKSANGLFIRESFKNEMSADFTGNFEGDLRYDSFASPDSINAWVRENTDGMINGILSNPPDPSTMIILLNAIAMDERWADEFECDYTNEEDFTLESGESMKASMMHGGADKYFKTDNATGIVREYKEADDGSAFEFVGILPNGTVEEYLSNYSDEEIAAMAENEIEDGTTEDDGSINAVSVKMPRFEYEYTVSNATGIMKDLGIVKAFDSESADFSPMLSEESTAKLSISSVIQKAYVQMTETGTKAAAVSGLAFDATAEFEEPQTYNNYEVDLNRPFVFLIRDKKTKEVVFEGIVEQPEEWSGPTCSE